VEAGERAWAQEEPTWGIWGGPEAELQIFSEQLADKDAIELGCGTAYISAWLSRRGASVVGIDNSEAQLGTARRLQRQCGLDFPLIHGDAQAIAYPDASFDFAISEYGACLWADPQHWVPKAARVLRPSGRLVFLTNSFLMTLCMPPEDGVAAVPCTIATAHTRCLRLKKALMQPLWSSLSLLSWSVALGFSLCQIFCLADQGLPLRYETKIMQSNISGKSCTASRDDPVVRAFARPSLLPQKP